MSTIDGTENASRIEFDVNLTCNSCVSTVQKALSRLSEISLIDINLKKQSVVVDTVLPSTVVKEAIEATGKKAVLKGYGANVLSSAVAELTGPDDVAGVVRFSQLDSDVCIVDGTVDGLIPGYHGLHIHEYGDISEGAQSIGGHYNPDGSNHGAPDSLRKHYGDLGNIVADLDGRSTFRLENRTIKVPEIIGRSLAISEKEDDFGVRTAGSSLVDGNSGPSVAQGIIARSAGLFQNPKRICQCDGVAIWDEQKKPSSL